MWCHRISSTEGQKSHCNVTCLKREKLKEKQHVFVLRIGNPVFMYYQFVLSYLQSSSKIYSPMLIYMGITVVSVLPNTRGSTLGRKREHCSENKSVRSKSQEFSRKFKRSGVCFNDLWRVLYVRICGDTFKNLSCPRAYWSLSETVTSLMILFISQQSDVEIVVRHWACDFFSFSEKCRKSKYRLFYSWGFGWGWPCFDTKLLLFLMKIMFEKY